MRSEKFIHVGVNILPLTLFSRTAWMQFISANSRDRAGEIQPIYDEGAAPTTSGRAKQDPAADGAVLVHVKLKAVSTAFFPIPPQKNPFLYHYLLLIKKEYRY